MTSDSAVRDQRRPVPVRIDRLRTGDLANLWAGSPGQPSHVALLAQFDTGPFLDDQGRPGLRLLQVMWWAGSDAGSRTHTPAADATSSRRRPLDSLRAMLGAAARRLPRLPTAVRRAAPQLRDVAPDVRAPAPRTSLPHRVGPGRRLVVVRVPLAELHAGGHAHHATINDLLLAAATTGLRETEVHNDSLRHNDRRR